MWVNFNKLTLMSNRFAIVDQRRMVFEANTSDPGTSTPLNLEVIFLYIEMIKNTNVNRSIGCFSLLHI